LKILLVFCHPRRTSFTGAVADAFAEGAAAGGHEIEFADLYAEDFDPVLREADEPDWNNTAKRYSDEVHAEMARVDRADAIVCVFPVWWWSVPAMLKGWIDRVWNLGWAYGPASLPHRYGLMIATAAASEDAFAKRGYDQAIEAQLNIGVMNYCGIESASIELFHETTGDDDTRTGLLKRARFLGLNFPTH